MNVQDYVDGASSGDLLPLKTTITRVGEIILTDEYGEDRVFGEVHRDGSEWIASRFDSGMEFSARTRREAVEKALA